MKKTQAGFTMIELIVVIVILGILAAAALPRFINFGSDARIAAVNGMAGSLRSAVSLVQSRYMVNGNMTATTVSVGVGSSAVNVTVAAGTGIPTGAAAGIGTAIQSTDGFTVAYGNPTTFRPTNGGSATCQAAYTPASGVVTVTTTGC